MKKIAIAVAALLVGSMSASAADLAARPYTKAPVAPIMVYNWTGCYIGGNVGGGWAKTEQTQCHKVGVSVAVPATTTARARG